jgi:NADH-quinone oxidoreductase subunit G
VVDICPVGALTDRDFRYKVRVWYLEKTESVCPGCSRGCNISVHTNTRRPWHNDGKRVARLKPRFNPEVNGHWLCDEGRYSYKTLDEGRLGRVLKMTPAKRDVSWDAAAAEIGAALPGGGVAFVASGMLSNEDWAAAKALFGGAKWYFTAEPDQVGEEDELLRRRDKVPNLKGAEALGLKSGSFDELAKDLDAGKVKLLYVVERDLGKVWGEERAKALVAKAAVSVFQGPSKCGVSEAVTYRLPATAYVEETGHFTNFEGKVQEYKKALEPIGEARPDWEIFGLLKAAPKAEAAA